MYICIYIFFIYYIIHTYMIHIGHSSLIAALDAQTKILSGGVSLQDENLAKISFIFVTSLPSAAHIAMHLAKDTFEEGKSMNNDFRTPNSKGPFFQDSITNQPGGTNMTWPLVNVIEYICKSACVKTSFDAAAKLFWNFFSEDVSRAC